MKDECQLQRGNPCRGKGPDPVHGAPNFVGFTGLGLLARGSMSMGSMALMALKCPITLAPDFVTNLATPGLAIKLLSGHLIGYHTAASDQTAKAFHREQTRWSRTCFPTTDPANLDVFEHRLAKTPSPMPSFSDWACRFRFLFP